MNYGVYISGNGTRLEKILNRKNKILSNVKLVFSDDKKNKYLEEKCNELNIKYILFDFHEIEAERNRKNELLSNKLLDELIKNKIDYCFSFGNHILKGKLLEMYKNKIINFHPAILPSYKGRKAIDKAIENKEILLGNTAHFIDEGIDTGIIILQSVQHIENFLLEGYDAILDSQIDMFYKLIDILENKRLKVENGKVVIKGADYSKCVFYPEI